MPERMPDSLSHYRLWYEDTTLAVLKLYMDTIAWQAGAIDISAALEIIVDTDLSNQFVSNAPTLLW